MVWHFGDCQTTGGDSGNPALYCDNNIGSGYKCSLACNAANGGLSTRFPTTIGNPSRLYSAKAALQNVINSASGSIDFGLERYTEVTAADTEWSPNPCSTAEYCCRPPTDDVTTGRCIPMAFDGYPDIPGSSACYSQSKTDCNLTYIAGCGTSLNCSGNCSSTQGGRVLVQPFASSAPSVMEWIDFTEDFCDNGAGAPRNPELRAAGATPLSGSLRTARQSWYQPIYNVSEPTLPGGATNPQYNTSSPLYDPQIDCRSYVNVIMTDGVETCEASSLQFSDPQTAVSELTAVNPNNPVKTYVIAMSFAQNEPCNSTTADAVVCPKKVACSTVNGVSVCACNADSDCGTTCENVHYTCGSDHVCHHPALASLNAMAQAGGTSQAHFANNQIDIEAAFADIAASTVKIELCNQKDDDCDGVCDEPYPDVAEPDTCNIPLSDPLSDGKGGRVAQTCTNDAIAGTHCSATGVYVCSADQRSEVCNAPSCDALHPQLCPTAETCNGIDDDCNGVVDDCVPNVPNSCCTGKCPGCNTTGVPQPETCNNCDDDCDGTIDNHLIDTGAACGAAIGVCTQGTTYCCKESSPTPTMCSQSQTGMGDRLVCLGGVQPGPLQCNGCDNNCDGITDAPSQACYPSGTAGCSVSTGQCQGLCQLGSQTCNATVCTQAPSYGACIGAVTPQTETCNGKDDDCDGIIDDHLTDSWIGMPCCPTGNLSDCMGSSSNTRCMAGSFQCAPGGSPTDTKTCVGGIAKSPEVCNGVDDDCDGIIDNVPGIGAACTAMGINTTGPCTAKWECNGTPGPGPNGLTCTQIVGPMPELCNGADDDCDGVIDDHLSCPMGSTCQANGKCSSSTQTCDPRVGVVGGSPCTPLVPISGTSFPATGPAPPCNPGETACKAGAIVCQGEVGPVADACNGVSTDCTGVPNTSGSCGAGLSCVQGNCVMACNGTEFPCPGGFVCDTSQNPPTGLCVPNKCVTAHCQSGFNCQIDSSGNATCVDPCSTITCPTGYLCKLGVCQDDSCATQGCPSGKKCVGTPPMCVTDPCTGVVCPSGEFCDANGNCTSPCGTCPAGTLCSNGKCENDPCTSVTCPFGEVCAVMNGAGMCVQNQCMNGCNTGLTCCNGMCLPDACSTFQCPKGATCSLDNTCNPTCTTPPTDEIAATGGGGSSGCSMTSTGSPSGSFAIVALFLLGLLLRRRVRTVALVVALGGAAAGCHVDSVCLNCTETDGHVAHDLATNDTASPPDLTSMDMTMVDSATPIDHGVVDMQCDLTKLDPNNCGACGNVCDFTSMHMFGACVGGGDAGTPHCAPSGCEPGWVQLMGHSSCDYPCTPTNGGVEICDGKDNDCNGVIDDGFGYPNYDSDPNNCGTCGNVCNLPGAVSACAADLATSKGICIVDHCINDGTDTYREQMSIPGMQNTTGCTYHCPFPSTTTTTGSQDCDSVACTFPAEVCNGIDDDCDFVVDDHLTDVGGACGQNCPGGQVARCIGQCQAGMIACTGGVTQCVGSTGPKPELCDGKDNDCNGVIDDPFGYPNYNVDPNNCGSCGNACALANSVDKCVTDTSIDASGKGVCEVATCNAGFNFIPSPGNCTGTAVENGPSGIGCNYQCPVYPSTTETCNGKDDNCNGLVDELSTACGGIASGMTTPSSFCASKGVCASQTIPINCGGASGWKCDYSKVPNVDLDANGNLTLVEKECDCLDNNCNGVTDLDGFGNLGKACSAGSGVCQASGTYLCSSSTLTAQCMSGSGSACFGGTAVQPNYAAATDEQCNGKDDDCNGLIDESTSYTLNGHTYQGWHDASVAVPKPGGGGNVYVYSYEASRPDATATSQGGNVTRACSKTTVKPWANVTVAQATAACAAVRDSKGQPLRLCTAGEWKAACEGPSGAASQKWSMSSNPTTYVAQICNDSSTSLSAPWATGSAGPASGSTGEQCFTDWAAAGQIHDLSGNLNEWTSTSVVNGSTTYNQLSGGAYDTPSGGTTCEFNFDIARPTFADVDIGFRCCADNPTCGDVASDPNNCGSCGVVCSGATPVCSNGACAASCAAGLTDCNNACVNEQTDFSHCGSCTNVCGASQTCSGGACACAAPASLCGGLCVNEQTDPNNCGACGKACGSGQLCQAGSCVASCTSSLTACGQSCVNTNTDVDNCGACGTACSAGQSCANGVCCASSSVCGGACTNLEADNNNCGTCGKACSAGSSCQSGLCCASGQTNCNGVCVNVLSDPNNCNVCGNVCPGGTCTNGSCCGAGLLECGLQCVNPLTDSSNCGTCYNACATGSSCQSGVCCATGTANCNGACVNEQTDDNNCGGCGVVCGGGSQCVGGSCGCPTYMSYCGGKCIPTADDAANCGGCGVVCGGATPYCENSQCVGSCTIPNGTSGTLTTCANDCAVDTSDDRNNCGGCGTTCAASQGCSSASCITAVVPFQPLTGSGQMCNSNSGFGPVITLATSGAPYPGSGGQCSGTVAATTFTFGICACNTYSGGGSQTIYGWDSTQGPSTTSAPGDLGGSVGINASFTNSSTLTLTGDLWAGSSLNLGNTTIYERLHAQTMAGGNYTIGGSAEVGSWSGSSGGTTGSAIGGVPTPPDKNLYSSVTPLPSGASWTENGGSLVRQAVNVQQPCKRCSSGDLVPIAAYVANYSGTNNHNSVIGLNADAFKNVTAAKVLDLPCGYYYLSQITSGSNVPMTIVAHGNTALFVNGNIVIKGGLSVSVAPGARLDVFVNGYVDVGSGADLGNLNTPANLRFYVAGANAANSNDAFTFGRPTLIATDIYTPGGTFAPTTNFSLYGALFTQDYIQGGGSMNVFYDRASAVENSICPPPTGGGCTTCLDCGNQACNIPGGQTTGTCGSCTSDAQCCAPLRCVAGTCEFTQF